MACRSHAAAGTLRSHRRAAPHPGRNDRNRCKRSARCGGPHAWRSHDNLLCKTTAEDTPVVYAGFRPAAENVGGKPNRFAAIAFMPRRHETDAIAARYLARYEIRTGISIGSLF